MSKEKIVHYLRYDDENIVSFDEETKEFGLFFKVDDEDLQKIGVQGSDDAKERTTGQRIVTCGSCKKIGHRRSECPVDDYMAECQDCGWMGNLRVPILDATCPDGHIHIKKIAP